MRIKQVILEGFKTYREKTVVDFESGINIIVGPNGVGKTNLLMALQFVLSHEYHTMPQKKLLQMMNNIMQQQTLPRIFVEITLDNMDRSLPEDSNEVKISREVANGKDLYHLNGRSISKDQIKSTLHTAGFSRVNSYHVIKQGNVTNLALASDADRLKMLKEAAGYNFWEELKLKGERNLDAKSNLKGVRKNIQDRKDHLDKLGREHSEYMRWEALSNKKKAVNACILMRDHSLITARIRQREEQRKEKASSVSLARIKLMQKKQLDLRKDELNSLQNMLENLNKSAKTLAVDLTSLDLEIKEREQKIQLPGD